MNEMPVSKRKEHKTIFVQRGSKIIKAVYLKNCRRLYGFMWVSEPRKGPGDMTQQLRPLTATAPPPPGYEITGCAFAYSF